MRILESEYPVVGIQISLMRKPIGKKIFYCLCLQQKLTDY